MMTDADSHFFNNRLWAKRVVWRNLRLNVAKMWTDGLTLAAPLGRHLDGVIEITLFLLKMIVYLRNKTRVPLHWRSTNLCLFYQGRILKANSKFLPLPADYILARFLIFRMNTCIWAFVHVCCVSVDRCVRPKASVFLAAVIKAMKTLC